LPPPSAGLAGLKLKEFKFQWVRKEFGIRNAECGIKKNYTLTDRSVAAQASQIEAQARTEPAQQRSEQTDENKDQPADTSANNLPNVSGSSQPSASLGQSINIMI
jgi:hypothetical protein